jgi:hypothetical protein
MPTSQAWILGWGNWPLPIGYRRKDHAENTGVWGAKWHVSFVQQPDTFSAPSKLQD